MDERKELSHKLGSHQSIDNSGDEQNTRQMAARSEQNLQHSGPARTAMIMFSLCMALFLAALDVTIITTALPTISQAFNADSSSYTWIASAYLLANASSTSVWGKISDIWGRKPIIILANIIFMVGSLVAALARSITTLIAARVVQGLGGGGLIVLVNICIGDLFSTRDRGKYYGFVGLVWAIAAGVGPVFGGVFAQTIGWRWCFWINLPVSGVSIILLSFLLQLDTPRTSFISGIKAVDWIGVITIIGGVIAVLYGLETGSWKSANTICPIVFGIVIVALFFVNEWKYAKYPIMPLRLFEDRSNIAAFGVCLCQSITYIGQVYYLPLYFQTVLGASPILSGVYVFALLIPISAASISTGVYIQKTGNYLGPVYIGALCLCLGTGLLIDLPIQKNWVKIIIYQVIAGIGNGPLFQSPLIALQSHLKEHDVAVGTSTFELIRNLMSAVGVVVGGVIFAARLKTKEDMLQAALGPELAARFAGSSIGSTIQELQHLSSPQRDALDHAYGSSFKYVWIFYTVSAGIAVILSFFITSTKLSTENEIVQTGVEEQERIRLEQMRAK